ncbi:GntP family permease [Acetobacterium sp.]|uniref:GntP family permease n=1 Tax=Acetobacterium sp. TaxID=1872094 RepID=UPI0027291525|nr:GntP family permease [Acetobacterium sp.]MDO9492025.1 GntP family permease [Acetobacterium sp.]
MTGLVLMITFVIAIGLMILAISKWGVHPFLAIMGVSLLLALVVGLPLSEIPGILGSGFAGIFTSIGIVIILGALIGLILEKTGAAIKLADMVVKVVGPKNPELALMIMGWIVAVPVFCDSGFVILNPIRKAMCAKTRTSSVAMTVALSAGLYTAHVFIPPTPGPIAAAGSLGVGNNLLLVIGMGTLVSVPTLLAALIFAKFIGRKVSSREELGDLDYQKSVAELVAEYGEIPSGLASLSPILVPILLMALGSISGLLAIGGILGQLLVFLGTPMIALAAGLLCALGLLVSTKKMADFYELTNETLKVVGPILFVTAAGGVLGKVIVAAGFVDFIQANAGFISRAGIFFPFLIAAILKTAQGSSTVAITTTAGIMGIYSDPASMMSALGLTSPMAAVLAVLAIGAGGMTVSHANDSYFWVVTNFGGMEPQDGYKTQTLLTLIMGVTAMTAIFILAIIFI